MVRFVLEIINEAENFHEVEVLPAGTTWTQARDIRLDFAQVRPRCTLILYGICI